MSNDPFKDLRNKLSLARTFPTLSLGTKEARAQDAIDRFVTVWQPLFSYMQAVSMQEEFRPQGKVLKAKVEYDEDSFSKRIYLRIGFCDSDQDMSIYIEPHLSFSCGLVSDATTPAGQLLYSDFDETFLAKVAAEDRPEAVYYMIRLLIADNFEENTEKVKFTHFDFEPCQAFFNKWLAVQISTNLGQDQPKAGTSRQFRFD